MVRECRPPAREPARSWLGRRSTMATSTPANANSPANISPVGPAPAITTACSVIGTLQSAPATRRRGRAAPHSPAGRTPAPPYRVPATAPQVPPTARRPRATHTSATTHAFRGPHFRGLGLRRQFYGRSRVLKQAPCAPHVMEWRGVGTLLSLYRPLWTNALRAKQRRAPCGSSRHKSKEAHGRRQ